MRRVSRSPFFTRCSFTVSTPAAGSSPSASDRSTRVRVVALTSANTRERYSGTIVLHGHTSTSGPSDRPYSTSFSRIGRRCAFGPA
ncbi:MAG: hypothetical protein U0804_06450 [Gemmataceae bacterium]